MASRSALGHCSLTTSWVDQDVASTMEPTFGTKSPFPQPRSRPASLLCAPITRCGCQCSRQFQGRAQHACGRATGDVLNRVLLCLVKRPENASLPHSHRWMEADISAATASLGPYVSSMAKAKMHEQTQTLWRKIPSVMAGTSQSQRDACR